MASKPILERITDCPNCNNKDNIKYEHQINGSDHIYKIYCIKCGNKVIEHGSSVDRSRTNAIKAWNNKQFVLSEDDNEIVEKVTIKNKPTKVAVKEDVKFDIHLLDSLPRQEIIKLSKYLIKKFNENNPKEDCPVNLGDLLKLLGLSNEEIISSVGDIKLSKKYLKKWDEVIRVLNAGQSIYCTDSDSRVWKYSSVKFLSEEDYEETIRIMKSIGITEKNVYTLKK